MRRELQLYIQDTRVDLFKDETVSLTDSIKNVKDIKKVFTTFTKTFTLPASSTNNKLFKHNYNFNIEGGFDNRKKVDAKIELNHVPFRTGKIKLEGVDLKENQAHTYRVTFFGNIVELKDKLGEKKLSDLDLTSYNTEYNPTAIETNLTSSNVASDDIIAPLITHSQRLFYNSDTSVDVADSGNLHYHSGGGQHIKGVKWNELKYALRVNKIIEAIETDFNLSFSSDFFKNTSLTEFDHLYMWLHRKSGAVEDLSGSTTTFETIVDGWTPATITDGIIKSTFGYEYNLTATTFTTNIPTFDNPTLPTTTGLHDFYVQLETTDTDAYDVALQRDGITVFSKTNHTGDIKISADSSDTHNFTYAAGSYQVIITSTSQISFSGIFWYSLFKYQSGTSNFTLFANSTNANTGAYNTNSSFTFNVDKQIPDMKIIDFLTGLFKLFNLVAYVESNVIQVKPLDTYYSSFNTYDITQYTNVDKSQVNTALPFKEIIFEFEDTDSFLANTFGELNNRKWGKIFYNEGQDLAESEYKIQAPFGHFLFERISDTATTNNQGQRNIQWGYSVDSNQDPYIGKPLLFYPVYVTTGVISFVDAVDINNVATSHKQITKVNIPSNTPSVSSSTNDMQLNFNNEVNEYTNDTTFVASLFEKYYSNYIRSVFNVKQRITKVNARLPMNILLNYSLADKFIISGKSYRINSITTNLTTGEADIELLNIL
ncbi:MAG: hypothetical protein CMJ25_18485 [Phycisphaerae bacterium]|nr:hypothetical protein [Phycisphaerae bacterium]